VFETKPEQALEMRRDWLKTMAEFNSTFLDELKAAGGDHFLRDDEFYDTVEDEDVPGGQRSGYSGCRCCCNASYCKALDSVGQFHIDVFPFGFRVSASNSSSGTGTGSKRKTVERWMWDGVVKAVYRGNSPEEQPVVLIEFVNDEMICFETAEAEEICQEAAQYIKQTDLNSKALSAEQTASKIAEMKTAHSEKSEAAASAKAAAAKAKVDAVVSAKKAKADKVKAKEDQRLKKIQDEKDKLRKMEEEAKREKEAHEAVMAGRSKLRKVMDAEVADFWKVTFEHS
jgi:hypothetical protein